MTGLLKPNKASKSSYTVQKILPDVKVWATTPMNLPDKCKALVEQLETTLPSITTTVKTVISDLTTINSFVQSAADEVSAALQDNQLTDEEKAALGATLTSISDRLEG